MVSLNQATFLLLRVAEKVDTTLNYAKERGKESRLTGYMLIYTKPS